jgi:hypothetical protein
MAIGRRVDELRRDANAIVRPLHGSLDDGVHSKLARDLGQRPRRAAVAHD